MATKDPIMGVDEGVMDWQSRAACIGEDPTLFDPSRTTKPGAKDRKRVWQAKDICQGCPVKNECLAFGAKHRYYGVFGGEYIAAGHIVFDPHYRNPKYRGRAA